MKPAPVETTDPNMRVLRHTHRPLDTEADLIAAAASRGAVYSAKMVKIKCDLWCEEDDNHYGDCFQSPMQSHGTAVSWNNADDDPLAVTEGTLPYVTVIPWDPTIRF